MDKNAIKKYAVWARNELIERVSQKADQYEISADADPKADSAHGVLLTSTEKKQRASLIAKVKDKGMDQVMEEVAYTWFNRFAALRFMEVNNYLPSRIRVFTNPAGEFKPEILSEAIHLELDGLDMEKVYAFKDANDNEALFKYLIITQCNALSSVLPGMFQKIADYTELLFPDNLLREGSVVEQMISKIPEKDWNVSEGGQIEIIGWLYQYYISEKHENVVNAIGKKAIKKNDIPAATELFTPDWVVRYIIDNSMGRYWIERNPESNLKNELEYFVNSKDSIITQVNEKITPEQLTVFDPCMGSAHFGVYTFDVLEKIYTEYGYTEREAAASIVQNNLFGLDIDERAAQLASFAIMMKAMQYDKRFLKRGIQPHFYEIKESNNVDPFTVDYFAGDNSKLKQDIQSVIHDTKNAKEYGSIIQIAPVDFDALFARFDEIENDSNLYKDMALDDLFPLVREAKLLSDKYAVVATNPPYLNKFNDDLKRYLNDKYTDYSGDLFSTFIYRNFYFCKKEGYSGLMTPNVWMFISSFRKLREYIIQTKSITVLAQLAKGAFFKEASVDICLFVLQNSNNKIGTYIRLEQFKGDMDLQNEKLLAAIKGDYSYTFECNLNRFNKIDGKPFAYWISDKFADIFENAEPLSKVAPPKQGLATADNNRFLRLWFELNYEKIGFGMKSCEDAKSSGFKWFPYNKGGAFRRWYGNRDYVVNWQNDGAEIRSFKNENGKVRSRPQNTAYFFKPSITWSDLTSASFSGRYCEGGFIFDIKGSSGFPSKDNQLYLLGLLNSKISQECISVLNPTISTQVGDMARIPVFIDMEQKHVIEGLVRECVEISKEDWDSFETSWDFKKHPLIGKYKTIEAAFHNWEKICDNRFKKLKHDEEEINSLFINIYDVASELSAEVDDDNITIHLSKLSDDIKSFISYAVGCMFGRYSIDTDGLVYTGGDWDSSKYKTFIPDRDAIIPITDDEYFTDDIVGRFVEFVRTVYGADTLEENLKFIANALDEKGSTSREVIRNYFLNDFFKDHCNRYSVSGSGKRPIYWLFDSGKKNGFKFLIYMHRYQPDTIARIRTDYVHEQQARYRTAIEGLERQINGASTSERVRLNKQLSKLKDQAEETRVYEEKVHHLADQMIKIDLDNGVKHNYAIFQDVLAKIK